MLRFFEDLDASWGAANASTLHLRVIGSVALFLQTNHARGTTDSDVLETPNLRHEARARLLAIAGRGSTLSKKHGLWIDLVPESLPFLPQRPNWNRVSELDARLRWLNLEVLDVVDVIVSKLKRYSPADRDDVRRMVELGFVRRDDLVGRFRLAIDFGLGDAKAEDFPRYVEHLHELERDIFGVDPTEIELPDWLRER